MEWADGLCSAITTWTDSIRSTAQSLQGGDLTKDSLQSAAGDVKESTNTFVDDVKGLGKPDTEAGQQAEDLTEGLGDDLIEGAQKIESTVDGVSGAGDVLDAVSVVSGTVQMMSQQASSTFEQLEQLEPGGELDQGFQEADSCAQLRSSGG